MPGLRDRRGHRVPRASQVREAVGARARARRDPAGPRVRILHVTSDWKWTGPAAPMLQLLLAQRARGAPRSWSVPRIPTGGPTRCRSRRGRRASSRCSRSPAPAARSGGATAEDARRLRGSARRAPLRRRPHLAHARPRARGARDRRAPAQRRDAAGAGRTAAPTRSRGCPWNRWLFGRGHRRPALRLAARARRATRGCGAGGPCWARSARSTSSASRRGRPIRRCARRWASRRSIAWSASPRACSGTAASTCCSRRWRGSRSAVPEARLLVIGRGTHLEETARRPARAARARGARGLRGLPQRRLPGRAARERRLHHAGARLRRQLPRAAGGGRLRPSGGDDALRQRCRRSWCTGRRASSSPSGAGGARRAWRVAARRPARRRALGAAARRAPSAASRRRVSRRRSRRSTRRPARLLAGG